jgi:hypothetical protein
MPCTIGKPDIFLLHKRFSCPNQQFCAAIGEELMIQESLSPVEPSAVEQIATAAETAKAIADLSPSGLEKLMLIANHFCRSRGLVSRTMEPEELLGEAIRCTLSLQKRWRKGISMLKHLDRAMENISGHTVNRAYREAPPVDSEGNVVPIEDVAVARDSVTDQAQYNETLNMIRDAFAEDPQAWAVLNLRMKEHSAEEIRNNLNLSDYEYETIAKRIRRKVIKLRFK